MSAEEKDQVKKDRSTTILSVRFTPDEIRRLREDAERAGVPVSSLVRKSALSGQTLSYSVVGNGNNGSTGSSVVMTLTLNGDATESTPTNSERARELTYSYDESGVAS